jgi:hypothetical protein
MKEVIGRQGGIPAILKGVKMHPASADFLKAPASSSSSSVLRLLGLRSHRVASFGVASFVASCRSSRRVVRRVVRRRAASFVASFGVASFGVASFGVAPRRSSRRSASRRSASHAERTSRETVDER